MAEPSSGISPGAASIWRLVSKQANTIVAFNRNGSGPGFYCIHPVAGDVSNYRDLAAALGPQQRCYGFQVTRDKMNAASVSSIESLARQYVEMLVAFQPEGDLVLGGWSIGAIIALEMAQQLLKIGRGVPLLIALDGAPSNTATNLNPWSPVYVWKVLYNMPFWVRDTLKYRQSHVLFRALVHNPVFRPRSKLPVLRNEKTLHGAAVQDVLNKPGWSNTQQLFVHALYDAIRAYVPRRYPGRVVVYEAKVQPFGHLLQVGASWSKIAPLTEIVAVNGSHNSMFKQPALGVLAEHIRLRLTELRQSEMSTMSGS